MLSYKHHEPHLLETAYADLACRGRLEQHLADRATTLPLVPRFLTILALAAARSTLLTEGAAIARSLAADAGPSRPPRRSLVGSVEGYDVALLRDKLDGHERFSLILGNDRKKGAKAARILCEVDEFAIHVRGVEVAEEQRGRGLAKLALGTLAALGVLVDADVRARPQTKPVVARALTSLGLPPRRRVVADPDRAGRWRANGRLPRGPDGRAGPFQLRADPRAAPRRRRGAAAGREAHFCSDGIRSSRHRGPRGDGACRVPTPRGCWRSRGPLTRCGRGCWRSVVLCCCAIYAVHELSRARRLLAPCNSTSIPVVSGCAPPSTRRAIRSASSSVVTASRRSSSVASVLIERLRVIPTRPNVFSSPCRERVAPRASFCARAWLLRSASFE